MKTYNRDPECLNCDEEGWIEMDCIASCVAVRFRCDCDPEFEEEE